MSSFHQVEDLASKFLHITVSKGLKVDIFSNNVSKSDKEIQVNLTY